MNSGATAVLERPLAEASEPETAPAPMERNGSKSSDSDDEMPLAQRRKAPAIRPSQDSVANVKAPVRASVKKPIIDDSSSEDDDLPLAARKAKLSSTKKLAKPASRSNGTAQVKRKAAASSVKSPAKRAKSNGKDEKAQKRWDTLIHAGVLFPPEYEPHGVKMLYEGKPVDLTPEQEEVATLFAVMKETDYMQKQIFLKNFWADFKVVLGKNHVIQHLDKCDFTPIYEYHMKLREEKKNKTKEEKEKDKKEKDEREAKYKIALVDGRQEQVGNFRVEPPGLFRGRGEHPKMGKLKTRIYPRDITINIGEGAPIPEHPYPGQKWKEVRHDKTVTWLAFWKDPINTKEYKYVWLAANSSFKTDSDLAKYEKARKLKYHIGDIRKKYEEDWSAKDAAKRQMAVALYFIDELALRAGHEKDEDEADTVGCCTLKVENVECVPPSHIKFDFLGKDSIRYENTVKVAPKVYKAIGEFRQKDANGKSKKGEDQLFDSFDATALNTHLKGLGGMEGLSVKVFRTYNASITLDRLLAESNPDSESVDARKADYDRANKEVAVLCNHQRSVPKGHQTSMDKLDDKIVAVEEELAELQRQLKAVSKGSFKPEAGKKMPSEESLQNRIEKKEQQLQKLHLSKGVREDLKTVALGTSKINYMDPRITVAWCKRNEVPIEKIFNKSLLTKFLWAMDIEPDFRF